ncbi:hypothetical protein [Fluviispira sanaruensis]|uniref:Uncharacterized protein n=1 Tax=Fluviispira sanaruensis TaxID=2493639 RepID=A0A4P2VI82_FLUSA|nr:hypothetical protein [Fluviispira sanaruensis]BBH52793.1 hypothetical protein JCM31447_12360 [Fluviispira sanaruensis]
MIFEVESPDIAKSVLTIVERWGFYFSIVEIIYHGREANTGVKIDDIRKNLNKNNSSRNRDNDTSSDRRGSSRSAHHVKIVDKPIGGSKFGHIAR